VTFYRSDKLHITTQYVRVRGTRYAIAEMQTLGTARGPAGPGATICVFGVVGAAFVDCIGGGVITDGVRVVFASVMTALVVVFSVGAYLFWRHRPYELWVHCGVGPMLLYATRNEIEFGKVCRAIRRAAGPHVGWTAKDQWPESMSTPGL
jgi:hypothetical protein